jgi:hypothetical protein
MNVPDQVIFWATVSAGGRLDRKTSWKAALEQMTVGVRKSGEVIQQKLNEQAFYHQVKDLADKTGQYLNPEWTELLMGLPVGYLDLTRLLTFPVSPLVRANINIRMNRRAQQRKRAFTTKNGYKRLGMRSYGSKPRR